MVVGSRVRVVRPGTRYPVYKDFFAENNCTHLFDDYMVNYGRYGEDVPKDGDVGTVVFIGEHKNKFDNMVVIAFDRLPGVFLFGERGLEDTGAVACDIAWDQVIEPDDFEAAIFC